MPPLAALSYAIPNAHRVSIARTALASASWARGDLPAVADEAVIDLLADLRHFCAARRIDFDSCNRIAQNHFSLKANERSEAIQRRSVGGEAEWGRARPAQRLRRTAKTSRTTTPKGPARLAVDTTGQEG